jgi:HTH-type transcriptional regulator/antitoxin HigA
LERYRACRALIAEVPRKELSKRGWLNSSDEESALAAIFFGPPIGENTTFFRKSSGAHKALLMVWLAQARSKAEYACIDQRVPEFKELTVEDLRGLARLSVNPKVVRELPAKLAERGVILIYLESLPGMKADGAVFRLTSGHPVVAMSLRFPRLDYFWFTLLHELGHVVLHLDRLADSVFFDVESEGRELAEKEANRLAKDSLVEPSTWRNCEPKYETGDEAVRKYAARQGVHPSIVAGLLSREAGNYTRYSKIINEHDVRQILLQP